MWAVPSVGDPWWHQRAAGCGHLTPVYTRTSDCIRCYLVNSREQIGLLLLLVCISSRNRLNHQSHKSHSLKLGYQSHHICGCYIHVHANICQSIGLARPPAATFDCIFVGFLSILSFKSGNVRRLFALGLNYIKTYMDCVSAQLFIASNTIPQSYGNTSEHQAMSFY